MSRVLDWGDYETGDFELGETVTFMHAGERLYGKVVRVYNTRSLYHVEHNGRRYEVEPSTDDMRHV